MPATSPGAEPLGVVAAKEVAEVGLVAAVGEADDAHGEVVNMLLLGT